MKPYLLAGLIWAGLAAPAWAACTSAYLSAAEITDCLAQPKTSQSRSFQPRNLAVTHAETAGNPDVVNLLVTFDFGSAALTTDTKISLDQLAQALSSDRLADKRFVLAGHTDAVGSAEFNQVLSENRAKAVRDYMLERSQVAAGRLAVEGWGASKLLNPQDPASAENRRVEVRVAD